MDVVRRHGHEPVNVRAVGLGRATDPEIARFAKSQSLCIITGDYDFADIRSFPPEEYAGLVVLYLPSTATARYIEQLLDYFFSQEEALAQLPGKLVIVEPGRLRIRGGQ